MSTIQIRGLSKKQREILDNYKKEQEIATDSGAIRQLLIDFHELSKELQDSFIRFSETAHERDKYLIFARAMQHGFLTLQETSKQIDELINGKGGKNG